MISLSCNSECKLQSQIWKNESKVNMCSKQTNRKNTCFAVKQLISGNQNFIIMDGKIINDHSLSLKQDCYLQFFPHNRYILLVSILVTINTGTFNFPKSKVYQTFHMHKMFLSFSNTKALHTYQSLTYLSLCCPFQVVLCVVASVLWQINFKNVPLHSSKMKSKS